MLSGLRRMLLAMTRVLPRSWFGRDSGPPTEPIRRLDAEDNPAQPPEVGEGRHVDPALEGQKREGGHPRR